MLNEYFLIGEVVKPQGVTGEIKIKPFSHDLDNLTQVKEFFLLKNSQFILKNPLSVRVYDRFIYIRFEDVLSREQVEQLRGEKIYIHRSQGAPLAEEEHYIIDLVGCKVIDTQNNPIGTLIDVLQPGGVDVYVIETPKGKMMLPALLSVIPKVNIKEKWILLNEDKLDEVAVFED